MGRGEGAWPSFLRGEDASEILAHLSSGDPLRMFESIAQRLRATWFLLEVERVHLHALAVCAEAASVEEPPPDLERWRLEKIDLTIERLVRADREAEETRPEVTSAEDRSFALVTECLMIEPELARRCSVAFNALPPLPRRAFFELLVEGREVVECIESGPWDEDGLYVAVHQALAAIGLDLSQDPPPKRRAGRSSL